LLPSGGIKIAKIFGIEILINPTWLLIFVLVGFSLAETMRDASIKGHPGRFPAGPWPWIFGFGTALVFFACLLAHELSHSWVAKRHGVKIRRITLFIFGGVAEMSEDVSDASTELRMAIAGPLMTFFLAGVFYGLYRLVGADPQRGQLWIIPLYLLFAINLFVGVFNLLPGFPLDGGRIFRALLWKYTGDLRKATRAASIGGQVVAVGMAGLGIYFLAVNAYVSGIWLVLVGLFVFQLSRASYRQTLYRIAVADTRASELMYKNIPTVEANMTLTTLATNYFGVYHLPAFPVVNSEGRVIGTISRDELTAVNSSEWDVLNAGRVARPLDQDKVIDPDTSLDSVMRKVMRAEDFLLVMRDGRVEGILTADELMRYIKARVQSGPQ
jgi:Zn-dependent protease/predicted transcriptional regulator